MTETMRAAVLRSDTTELALVDIPVPVPRAGEALVKAMTSSRLLFVSERRTR